MYTFGHISVKQRQLPDQQVDSGPWIVQLCENDSGLNSNSGWHLTPSHVWSTREWTWNQIMILFDVICEHTTHYNITSLRNLFHYPSL